MTSPGNASQGEEGNNSDALFLDTGPLSGLARFKRMLSVGQFVQDFARAYQAQRPSNRAVGAARVCGVALTAVFIAWCYGYWSWGRAEEGPVGDGGDGTEF